MNPVGALLLCASANADYTVVNGRVVVREGRIDTVDMGPLIERHNTLARQLALAAQRSIAPLQLTAWGGKVAHDTHH